jgi:hypothetical protein
MGYNLNIERIRAQAKTNLEAAPTMASLYIEYVLPGLRDAHINPEDFSLNAPPRQASLVLANSGELIIAANNEFIPICIEVANKYDIPLWAKNHDGLGPNFTVIDPQRHGYIRQAESVYISSTKQGTSKAEAIAAQLSKEAAEVDVKYVNNGYSNLQAEIGRVQETLNQTLLLSLAAAQQIGIQSEEQVIDFLTRPLQEQPIPHHLFDSNTEIISLAGLAAIGDLAFNGVVPEIFTVDKRKQLALRPNIIKFLREIASQGSHGGCPVIGYVDPVTGRNIITVAMRRFGDLYLEAKYTVEPPAEPNTAKKLLMRLIGKKLT